IVRVSSLPHLFSCVLITHSLISSHSPYTTLFRSRHCGAAPPAPTGRASDRRRPATIPGSPPPHHHPPPPPRTRPAVPTRDAGNPAPRRSLPATGRAQPATECAASCRCLLGSGSFTPGRAEACQPVENDRHEQGGDEGSRQHAAE